MHSWMNGSVWRRSSKQGVFLSLSASKQRATVNHRKRSEREEKKNHDPLCFSWLPKTDRSGLRISDGMKQLLEVCTAWYISSLITDIHAHGRNQVKSSFILNALRQRIPSRAKVRSHKDPPPLSCTTNLTTAGPLHSTKCRERNVLPHAASLITPSLSLFHTKHTENCLATVRKISQHRSEYREHPVLYLDYKEMRSDRMITRTERTKRNVEWYTWSLIVFFF